MSGRMKKDIWDHIPILKDQGIRNVVGAHQQGVSLQVKQIPMPAGGVIVFADHGLSNMADAEYSVFTQNQTDVADPGTVGSRTTAEFTITGPDAADVLDILIIGKVKGQLG